ncbi:MAG: hypothetical protein NVS1B1_08060 [Candidatus Limnocylindrales bacterium]
MTLLAHAIGPAVFPVPATDGLRGRVLRRVAVPAGGPDHGDHSLGLWAPSWDGPPGPLARDDAFGHHAIVAAIAAAGPCLPVRFGSWVDDDTAAVDLLAGREGAFRAGLQRVAGRSELAVTLLWLDSPVIPGRGHAPAPAGPGREGQHPGRRFLEARRREQAGTAARQATAEGLAGQLAALFVELGTRPEDLRHEICPTAEVALTLSALVRTADASPVKEAVSRLTGGLGGVRGVVSGPWPPYSFTPELR